MGCRFGAGRRRPVGGFVVGRAKRRVRLHLVDRPGVALPSVEGVLLGRRSGEYRVADPALLLAVNAEVTRLSDAAELRVPRENVAFYEVLR